jgi:hypothetical protein
MSLEKAIACLDQADKNFNLANELLNIKSEKFIHANDWAITITYYSASMYLQQFCLIKGIQLPSTHYGRSISGEFIDGEIEIARKYLGKNARLNFKTLYEISRKMRYDPLIANSATTEQAKGYFSLLQSVKESVMAQLSKS